MWHFYSFVFTFHISTSIDCDFVSWRGCMAFLEKTWQEIAGKAVGNNIHVRYASILNAPSDFYFRFEQALGRSQALWMIDITAKLRWDKPLRHQFEPHLRMKILGHHISRIIIITLVIKGITKGIMFLKQCKNIQEHQNFQIQKERNYNSKAIPAMQGSNMWRTNVIPRHTVFPNETTKNCNSKSPYLQCHAMPQLFS